jgi:hypothetical protein
VIRKRYDLGFRSLVIHDNLWSGRFLVRIDEGALRID